MHNPKEVVPFKSLEEKEAYINACLNDFEPKLRDLRLNFYDMYGMIEMLRAGIQEEVHGMFAHKRLLRIFDPVGTDFKDSIDDLLKPPPSKE